MTFQPNAATGTVAPGFEPVRDRLNELLQAHEGYSAQLSARWKGELVVDLTGGPDLTADSISGVFSVSKGVAAVTLAILVNDGRLDLDARVADYWPEFAAHGKEAVLVREVLSHQTGLLNTEVPLALDEFQHSERAAKRLADSLPVWRPGSAFGYHGLTIGVVIEELVRRICGESLQSLYEREVRAPRAIDFYLGLPEAEEGRFIPVMPWVLTDAQRAEQEANPMASDGLAAFAFNSLHVGGLGDEGLLPNTRVGRVTGFSSTGGVGSARGIADVYAAALGYLGDPLLSAETIAVMSQEQISGTDRLLYQHSAFATVFAKPNSRLPFGSYRAFGHDGAAGALGFADPMYDLAFGYIPLPMQYPGGADPKGMDLSAVIRRCILLQS